MKLKITIKLNDGEAVETNCDSLGISDTHVVFYDANDDHAVFNLSEIKELTIKPIEG